MFKKLMIKYYRWRFQLRVGKPGELTQEEFNDMDDEDIWYMRDIFQGFDGFIGRR